MMLLYTYRSSHFDCLSPSDEFYIIIIILYSTAIYYTLGLGNTQPKGETTRYY